LGAITSLSGCFALDDFDVEMRDSVTVPGNQLGIGTLAPLNYDGKLTNFKLSSEQTFANQGVKPGDIDHINVRSISLTDSQPNLHNFKNVLDELVLFVEAPGQPKVELARGSNFPDAATVDLVVNATLDLKLYAEAENMKISAEVKLKQQPLNSFKIETLVVLHIDINLLGT